MTGTVWNKDPDEVVDFTIDWVPELGGADTIASSTWLGVTAGIATGAPASTFTPTTTTIWVSGGTAGVLYGLTNRIMTTGGRTYDQEVSLRVTPTAFVLPDFSGCDWPIDPACLTEVWDSYDDDVRERAVHLASSTLYRLTGYRVGGCPVTVRPSRQIGSCDPRLNSSVGFSPINWNGQWANTGCVGMEDPRVVELPAPVGRIDEVKVDGIVIDDADYTIMADRYLVWTGLPGTQPWPSSQDWVLPDTEPGTFSVTYLNAYEVDSLGAYAAGLLAMEFAVACGGGGKKCKLPSNIISIVRQGVTYELSAGAFPDGKTTIREVDGFIEKWNPHNRLPGIVINPNSFGQVYVQR